MILSALDEVLFWQDLDLVIQKVQELTAKFYPHDPVQYFAEKNKFYQESIGSKAEFCRRLALYRDQGSTEWIASRTGYMDDLSAADLKKARQNATMEEAAARVTRMKSGIDKKWAALFDYYTSAILSEPANQVLELTIGAGGGTHILMEKMGKEDTYTGIDIDFRCAKTADGLGKYYGVTALGLCCNLWALPFDDSIFSVICSRNGMDECREIPSILCEASRVLRPGGKIVLTGGESGYLFGNNQKLFEQFGFDRKEAEQWLHDVRLYANLAQLDEIAGELKLTKTAFQKFIDGHFVVEYTK